ncbi:hypothetical protein PWJ90_15450 [Nocardia gipuzkoensis]|nr:hypothetical protein [Nocardia gipuzkoensis]MDE1671001.1 hypothetical protein [Nocardia gipuzkoensis]
MTNTFGCRPPKAALGDQILMRTRRTMTPTPYALAVREQVHDLLRQVQGVLATSRELDLATLERTFTLRWHDALVVLSGPALLAAVREQAPGVRLRFIAESSIDTPSCGAARSTSPRTRTARLHPRFAPIGWPRPSTSSSYGGGTRSPMSRPSPPRGPPRTSTSPSRGAERLGSILDDALARLDLTRRVVATAPTERAAFEFVRGSDLLVTAPESTARSAAADLGLILLPLPFDLPRVGRSPHPPQMAKVCKCPLLESRSGACPNRMLCPPQVPEAVQPVRTAVS